MRVKNQRASVLYLALYFFVAMACSCAAGHCAETDVSNRKKEFFAQSEMASFALTKEGVLSLEKKDPERALLSFMEAAVVFPAGTQAYEMLVKTYLMLGQEQNVYETLEKAGRSYPSFDRILGMIDDKNLNKIPLPVDPPVFIAPFQGHRKAAISFMFDDGEGSVYSGVLPLFEKYGFKATIPVIPSTVSSVSGNLLRGSWAEWRDAASRGFEIANHSMSHRNAKAWQEDDLEFEVDDAKAMIEEQVGQEVRSFVFPMDSYADIPLQHVLKTHSAVRKPDLLRSVYDRSLVIVYGGPNFSLPAANRMVDIAMQRRLWVVSESHGLDARGVDHYKPMSNEFLDGHLAYIRSHGQDIWVDTFGSVFGYLSLRKATHVGRREVSDVSAEVMLHHDGSLKDLPRPLTVVLKVPRRSPASVLAVTASGRRLKAWGCGAYEVCVDTDVCDEPIGVLWSGGED